MGVGARLGILGLMIVAIAVARLIEVELDSSRDMPPLVVQQVNDDEAPELEGLGIEVVDDAPPASAQQPEPAAPAPKPAAKKGKTYVVQPGDTLGAISTKVYGTSKRWKAILEANRDTVPRPEALRAGIELKIPPK